MLNSMTMYGAIIVLLLFCLFFPSQVLIEAENVVVKADKKVLSNTSTQESRTHMCAMT